jgi:hypothetical protein
MMLHYVKYLTYRKYHTSHTCVKCGISDMGLFGYLSLLYVQVRTGYIKLFRDD